MHADHIFELKIVAVVGAVVLALIIQMGARKWSDLPEIPMGAKLIAALSILC